MPVVVNDRLTVPDAELAWTFTPSGGPGGQHANRSNTRVELTWRIIDSDVLSTGERDRLLARVGPVLTVVADDERSQARNRDIAVRRLAQRVREGLVVPRRRRPTRPTRGSKERRLRDKRARSENKRRRRPPSADD